MADRRRNHFIPRFLLSRFASRREGRKSWVWQISRDGSGIEISTRDAAVAKDFYGGPVTGVEDDFEKAEQQYSQALSAIESGGKIEDYRDTLRELVWTLAIRTRALRHQFTETVANLTNKIVESVSSRSAQDTLIEGVRARLLGKFEEELSILPSELRAAARRDFERSKLHDEMLQAIEDLVRSPFPQVAFGRIRDMMRTQGVLEKAVEDGQIQGLSRLLNETRVPESFLPAQWELCKVEPPQAFILGDTCVVAVTGEGRACSLLQSNDTWEILYLPISRSRVLVAGRHILGTLWQPEEINRASAELSSSHIYCSEATDVTRGLASLIGNKAVFLSDAEISEIAESGW